MLAFPRYCPPDTGPSRAADRGQPQAAHDHALVERVRATLAHATSCGPIDVTAAEGVVTLCGAADFFHQRGDAERAVRFVPGVRGVRNLIAVTPTRRAAGVHARIRQALLDQAEHDARRVRVSDQAGTLMLLGTVSSRAHANVILEAARFAAGGAAVQNMLKIHRSTPTSVAESPSRVPPSPASTTPADRQVPVGL